MTAKELLGFDLSTILGLTPNDCFGLFCLVIICFIGYWLRKWNNEHLIKMKEMDEWFVYECGKLGYLATKTNEVSPVEDYIIDNIEGIEDMEEIDDGVGTHGGAFG